MDPKRILLVEDDPNDVELTLTAFDEYRLANEVDVVGDGQEALDYLHRRGRYQSRPEGNPAVVLLDLKLPRVDGIEVLRHIRTDAELKTIPVVMLTSSHEEKDLAASYDSGVNAYVVKPVHFEDFLKALNQTGLFWLAVNEPPPGTIGRPQRTQNDATAEGAASAD